jgi:hypothetical protein
MTKGLLFWILMLLWLVLGIYVAWPAHSFVVIATPGLLFVLLALLGWQVFGKAIK